MTRPVAVVTGASRGIGKAVAERLAREGHDLVLAARTEADLSEVAAAIEAGGAKALAVPTDVSKEKDVVRLFERVKGEFGRCDVIVNNAGLGVYVPVAETSLEDWEKVMGVNARGTFLCSREAFRMMESAETPGGVIVNISSVVGIKGYARQGAYTASKHAVVGLSKVLAEEGRDKGIRVHAICPGGVATGLISSARPDINPDELLQPEDIADLVAYLVGLPKRAMVDLVHIRRATSKPY
ncbi:MAG: SDR family oxidoreductase [Planctomycetota bacterium]|jgi:3-oxoacyl-[acyl-carrier protein] reductase